MTPIVSHVADCQARFLSQYQSLSRVMALAATFAERVQVLENAILAVFEATPLNVATGAQLDNQGAIIGLPRNGLDDATYRVLLFGQIALNNSDATTDAILQLIKLTWQTSAVFIQTPNTGFAHATDAPAQLSLQICDPQTSLSLLPTLLSIVKKAIPAGCALTQVDIVTAQNGGTFAFAGNQAWVQGFGTGAFATPAYRNPVD